MRQGPFVRPDSADPARPGALPGEVLPALGARRGLGRPDPGGAVARRLRRRPRAPDGPRRVVGGVRPVRGTPGVRPAPSAIP
ncbi:hypothetical protein AB0D29_06055 [Streptomyces sp. NPDC048424]|uniref:hypothetical protein n=1 Tax=Streptomyces sp. NPDC048424 TaxID=3155265 RepID=UPI00344459DE